MNPDQLPINSMRDNKPSVDYSVLGRLDKIASKLIAVEDKLDQLLAKKKPAKPRTANKVYSEQFEDVWKIYPKRSGSNPKNKAYSAYCKRIEEGSAWIELKVGVEKYAAYCDAQETTGTSFVMHASTFFGLDMHYLYDWTIPKKKPEEDPDKQHHPDFDPEAEVIVPEGVNPYPEIAPHGSLDGLLEDK